MDLATLVGREPLGVEEAQWARVSSRDAREEVVGGMLPYPPPLPLTVAAPPLAAEPLGPALLLQPEAAAEGVVHCSTGCTPEETAERWLVLRWEEPGS